MKKIHACQLTLKKYPCCGLKKFIQGIWWRKKLLRLENSPPPHPSITFLMVRPLRDGKESWVKFNDDEVERHFKEMHFESYDAGVWLDDAFLSEMHLTTCQTRTICATWRDPSLYSWAKWLWWDALSPLCSTRLTWRGPFLLTYSFKALKHLLSIEGNEVITTVFYINPSLCHILPLTPVADLGEGSGGPAPYF